MNINIPLNLNVNKNTSYSDEYTIRVGFPTFESVTVWFTTWSKSMDIKQIFLRNQDTIVCIIRVDDYEKLEQELRELNVPEYGKESKEDE